MKVSSFFSRKWKVALSVLGIAALVAGCGSAAGNGGSGNQSSSGHSSGKKYKVYLDLSYSGNAWQNEGANIIKALAATPPYNKEVEFKEIISGTSAQQQISDIQSMIAQGANAIIFYPISPTALNSVVEQAVQQHVLMFAYDSTVTAPGAYNVSYITAGEGQNTAQYLVNTLHGKGNIFMSRGVAGTAVDDMQYNGAMSVFKKYPGIHVIDQYYSNWDDVLTKQNTEKALAAHPNVDGVWAEAGEYGAIEALQAMHHKLVPVTGENSNGFRLALANKSYNAQGLVGVSAGSPPASGGYAFKLMMELLTGQLKNIPHNIQYPIPWVPYNDVKVCTGDTFTNGCNAFPASKVPSSFVTEVFNPTLVPEISLESALKGTPTLGMTIQPIPPKDIVQAPAVPGINTQGTTVPPNIYALNTSLVKPIPVPAS